MAESTLSEITVLESDLIQSIQSAIRSFESRNQGMSVADVTYIFKSGGAIQYDVKLKDSSSPIGYPDKQKPRNWGFIF